MEFVYLYCGGVYLIIIKKRAGWRLYDSLIECVGDNIIH